jgi:hypothetical protein
MYAAPCPTLDSILNRKFAGCAGVTVLKEVKNRQDWTGVSQRTKIPEERGVHGEILSPPSEPDSGTSLAERMRTCWFDVVETENRVKSLGVK